MNIPVIYARLNIKWIQADDIHQFPYRPKGADKVKD
jgi:hypothetical protein